MKRYVIRVTCLMMNLIACLACESNKISYEDRLSLLPNDCKLLIVQAIMGTKKHLAGYKDLFAFALVGKQYSQRVKQFIESLEGHVEDLDFFKGVSSKTHFVALDDDRKHKAIERALQDLKLQAGVLIRGWGLNQIARVANINIQVEQKTNQEHLFETKQHTVDEALRCIDPHCSIDYIQAKYYMPHLFTKAAYFQAIKDNVQEEPCKTFVYWGEPCKGEYQIIVFHGSGQAYGISPE